MHYEKISYLANNIEADLIRQLLLTRPMSSLVAIYKTSYVQQNTKPIRPEIPRIVASKC